MITKTVPIDSVKKNPINPRKISTYALNKLKERYNNLSALNELRGIIVNEDNVILGGNQRWEAAKALKRSTVHIEILTQRMCDKMNTEAVSQGRDILTYEQYEKEIILADNSQSGETDWDKFFDNWNYQDALDWDMDPPEKKDKDIPGEVEFSEYIGESNNYVVIVFDNDLDWLNAQTHFDLKTVSAKRSNGKEWSKGIGRVINGAKYLRNLNR